MRYFAAISGLDGFPVDEDFAGVGQFQADEVLEQDALATAARPHDDKDFPGPDLEINALKHFLAVKTFVQAAHHEADAGDGGWWRRSLIQRAGIQVMT